jgi:hypothetical protein
VCVGQVDVPKAFEGAERRFVEKANFIFTSGGTAWHEFAREEPPQVVGLGFEVTIATHSESPCLFGRVNSAEVVDAKVTRSPVACFENVGDSE